VDERALAEVQRLEQRDVELASAASRIRELGAEAEAVRARATEIEEFFAGYPDQESRRRAGTADARGELERRREEAARAAADEAAARDEEQLAAARRAAARAADRIAVAEARVARSEESEAELEQTAAALTEEIPGLEAQARSVSEAVPDLPQSPTGPRELIEWAARARAHLFVTASQLDAQRERVIREANELGTMLLGEPLYGATTTQVRTRVVAAQNPG
jgi:chromosome segregation ATPase